MDMVHRNTEDAHTVHPSSDNSLPIHLYLKFILTDLLLYIVTSYTHMYMYIMTVFIKRKLVSSNDF